MDKKKKMVGCRGVGKIGRVKEAEARNRVERRIGKKTKDSRCKGWDKVGYG